MRNNKMKFFLGLVMVQAVSANAFASATDLDVMKALLSSDSVTEVSDSMQKAGYNELIRVEKNEAPRCSGCGQYTLVFQTFVNNQAVEKTASFRTLEDRRGAIHVSLPMP